jgi:hypothetical protein
VTDDLLTARELAGIAGDEDRLTDADIWLVVQRLYSPGRAARVLDGSGWRPTGGLAGTAGDGLCGITDRRGIHALVFGPPARAGLIAWQQAEDLIRRAATPKTTAALLAAVAAYDAHFRAGLAAGPDTSGGHARLIEGGRLMKAEREAGERSSAPRHPSSSICSRR